jgi:Tfp pilus assembly protein PilN
VSAPLNLSRYPFRNERLPTLLLGVAGLLLLVATVRHGVVAWSLMPGRSGDVESRALALEAESASLSAEAAELQRLAPPPETIGEWAAVQDLVDRRAFSWTGLFSSLEEALPPGVRLVSVSPEPGEGGTALVLTAVGRRGEDALALLQSLQAHRDFEGAFLDGWREGQHGVDIGCTVRYAPRPAPEGRR